MGSGPAIMDRAIPTRTRLLKPEAVNLALDLKWWIPRPGLRMRLHLAAGLLEITVSLESLSKALCGTSGNRLRGEHSRR